MIPAIRFWLTAILVFCGSGLQVACGSGDSQTPQDAAPNNGANIMPLGDSITEASAGLPTYRYFLWQWAEQKGYPINLVGSRSGTAYGPPLYPDFDMDHEGHSGWRADELLAQIASRASASVPDIVLLHAGHNDLCQGQDVPSTVEDVAGIIDALRELNPRIAIVLAQLIASADPCHVLIPTLNAQLPVLAEAKTTPESPVVGQDMFSGFDPPTMTFDGVHPNATGEAFMADRWAIHLAPLLERVFASKSRRRIVTRRRP
ncbi:MAG TPA: SGNH/GDSL hydrolase family protein [Nitrospira sp.]|nr:SGNH/GDSL hydrolase family protein [Nitrospira sp.]